MKPQMNTDKHRFFGGKSINFYLDFIRDYLCLSVAKFSYSFFRVFLRNFVGKKFLNSFILILCVVILSNCSQQMASQPAHKPFEKSDFFADGQLAQKPVEGTIPSGWTRTNQRTYLSEDFDKNSNELPIPLTEEVLRRGKDRFEITCAVCHGATGDGGGMIARRGFSKPPTYHSERLRNAPLGHFYDVITNGYGGMGSYAAQVEPPDRWAIAAYIRALQVSQNANVSDVPPEKMSEFENGKNK